MENRAFYPESMHPPLGKYAHGVETVENSKLTFVAGQVGIDPDGNIPSDFAGQAELAWQNCMKVLEHNRLRMGDVVKMALSEQIGLSRSREFRSLQRCKIRSVILTVRPR